MSGVLKYTLVVRDEGGSPVALLEGQPVPDWAKDLVHADDLDGADDAPAGGEAAKSSHEGLTVAELKAEISKRNEGREDADKVVPDAPGNKPEMVAALDADDAKAAGTSGD